MNIAAHRWTWRNKNKNLSDKQKRPDDMPALSGGNY